MRRGTWILAISGVMALNQSSGSAADPVPGARANGGLPSRYARDKAANGNAPKNYYDELFAEPAPAKAKPPAAWESDAAAAASPPTKPAGRPASAPESAASAAAQFAPAAKPAPTVSATPAASGTATAAAIPKASAADSRRFAPAVRGVKTIPDAPEAKAPAAPETKVIQATYDKQPSTAERKLIQPVRGDSARRPGAPPLPDSAAPDHPNKPVAAERTVESGPVTPQVTVEWVKKGDINVGQECQLELHVKNSGTVPAAQLAIDGSFPSSVRLTSAEPKPTVAGDKVTWSFDTLAPGAEQTIAIKLIPSRRGDLGATANVRFSANAATTFRVEEPMLKVALKGPAEVLLGDPASQMILVSNPGTGTVHDVKVEARISDGLEHGLRGERLVMEVGSISPGETRTVRLGLSAVKGGAQSISIAATSSSDAAATAAMEMNVVAPSLKIAVDGPALRYKGRNAKYALTITNDGSVANNNIRIAQSVADGFKFVSADRNGKYDAATKSVQWFVGRLEPGQTAQVSCELNAVALGEFTQTASVLSDSGIRAEAKSQTRVDGTASLTMELVDLDDPVEIGAETAYEVRVKNEGSKSATGVSIACELPPEMELKTVKAPVDAIVEGRQILFKSLEQVAPGATVVYRIHVKGVQEGNHRMRVRMTSASLQEPVVREEATKVYADSK